MPTQFTDLINNVKSGIQDYVKKGMGRQVEDEITIPETIMGLPVEPDGKLNLADPTALFGDNTAKPVAVALSNTAELKPYELCTYSEPDANGEYIITINPMPPLLDPDNPPWDEPTATQNPKAVPNEYAPVQMPHMGSLATPENMPGMFAPEEPAAKTNPYKVDPSAAKATEAAKDHSPININKSIETLLNRFPAQPTSMNVKPAADTAAKSVSPQIGGG